MRLGRRHVWEEMAHRQASNDLICGWQLLVLEMSGGSLVQQDVCCGLHMARRLRGRVAWFVAAVAPLTCIGLGGKSTQRLQPWAEQCLRADGPPQGCGGADPQVALRGGEHRDCGCDRVEGTAIIHMRTSFLGSISCTGYNLNSTTAHSTKDLLM